MRKRTWFDVDLSKKLSHKKHKIHKMGVHISLVPFVACFSSKINWIRRLFVLSPLILFFAGCDALMTKGPDPGEAFNEPLEGLTTEESAAFLRGDEAFSHEFSIAEGLGPIFNQVSCERCHAVDGKGHPRTFLVRFGRTASGVTDKIPGEGGPQLQDHSIPGVSPEILPAGVAVSRRVGPVVFGMGLIEAIPEAEILSREDPLDLDGDGISGRANRVDAPAYVGGGSGHVGRFGRKAGTPFLLQQIVTAYNQDIGISTDMHPVEIEHPQSSSPARDDLPEPELSAAVVHDVAFYLRTLAPPSRGAITAETGRGKLMFTQVGCASCHTPTMRTGLSPIGALSDKDVNLYSDLLLHDMGPDLADNFYEGSSTGTEWRTTPLWGLRLVGEFLGGVPTYLHDGRTSDLNEVIQLHKGEADSSRSRYLQLNASDRTALIRFLESL